MSRTQLLLGQMTEPDRPITYGVVKPGPEDPDRGILLVRGGDIRDGKVALNGLRTITEDVSRPYARTRLRGGELLISLVGNPGEVAIAPEALAGANIARQAGLIALRAEFDARYVMYFLRSPSGRAGLFERTQGAVQQVINLAALKKIKISLPELSEQKRIAATLSAYDDLIEINRRRIGLLEEAARQLYKEWFVRFRFPGHEHVEVVDGAPAGWELVELANCVEVIKDAVDPKVLEPGTPYIGLEHLPRRSITLSDWETAEKVESGKFRFRNRDIIFGKIRPYFHKVGFALTEGITSSDAIVMRPKDDLSWACALMEVSSDRFVALASQTVKEGSKMPRANWDVLKKHLLVLPPVGLRQIFNDQIGAITSQTKSLSLAISQLTKARDLLLPKLMNGVVNP